MKRLERQVESPLTSATERHVQQLDRLEPQQNVNCINTDYAII